MASLDKLLGKQEIKLSENKDFSEKLVLQGANVDENKAFFTEARQQVFVKEHIKGYEYEADSDYFAVAYPLTPSIPIEEYEALLQKTTTLLTDLGI